MVCKCRSMDSGFHGDWTETLQCYMLLLRPPAEAVAEYCNEYVCVSVCVSVRPRGYLWNHMRDIYLIILCMWPITMAQSSSGAVTKSQRERAIWGFSSPLTKYCTV